MKGPGDEEIHELVIIKRRRGGEEEGHHGGVWKIAYADFMTAMMAFFLVMWLINAANEETRSQVASYFNPVKLIDSRTNTKGLQDLETGHRRPAEAKPGLGETEQKSGSKTEPAGQADQGRGAVQGSLQGPGRDCRSGDEGARRPRSRAPPSAPSENGGQAFLDPFDPQTWQPAPRPRRQPEKPDRDEAPSLARRRPMPRSSSPSRRRRMRRLHQQKPNRLLKKSTADKAERARNAPKRAGREPKEEKFGRDGAGKADRRCDRQGHAR